MMHGQQNVKFHNSYVTSNSYDPGSINVTTNEVHTVTNMQETSVCSKVEHKFFLGVVLQNFLHSQGYIIQNRTILKL